MTFPIRIRVALASGAALLVVVAALEAVAYHSVGAAIQSIVDHELRTRLAGVDDHLTRHLERIPWPELRGSIKEHPAFQPDLLRIASVDGSRVLEGPGLKDVALPQPAGTVALSTEGGAGRALRILTVRRRIDGRVYDLVLGTDLQFPARILGRLWLVMLLSLPLVVLAAGGAGYWISGYAMAPVSGLIAAARRIDPGRLDERIAVPATGDEIQRLAETMNAMLGRIEDGFGHVRQFTANASHELRTPLAIIRTNAEVALLNGGGRPSRDTLRRILREAERGSTLLEDLLTLARADAAARSRERRARTPVDLWAALSQACSDIRPLAEAQGLRLETRPPDRPCVCQADEEQLRRLWLILLDNAVKYTPPGGSITAGAGTDRDGRPFVSVEDTGIGIAAEHRARIFDRFYRVDKARSRSLGGTGLGLAIALHIAVSHGASIGVESEPGSGSRFTVMFPPAPRPAQVPAEITREPAIFR